MKKIEKFDVIKANVIDAVNIDRLSDQLSAVKAQVGGIKTRIENFISKDEAFWMSAAFFLLGLVIGMLISPKGNTSIGSNNQVHNIEGFEDFEDLEDFEEEEDCGKKKCCKK